MLFLSTSKKAMTLYGASKRIFSLRDLNLSQKHTFDRFFSSNFSKLIIMSEYFPSLQIDDFLQKN